MRVRDGVRVGPAEVDRLVDALWAHADPVQGLEHVRGRAEASRVDLIFFFRQIDIDYANDVAHRVLDMLCRCHEASSLLATIYEHPRT